MAQHEPNSIGDGAVAQSPCHAWHVARAAEFIVSDGWWVPAKYPDEQPETAHRPGTGLVDLSASWKVLLQGEGVTAATRGLLGDNRGDPPRKVVSLPGEGQRLACRLSQDRLLLLGLRGTTAVREQLMNQTTNSAVVTSDVSSAYAVFGLVGPQYEQVIRRLTAFDASFAGLPLGTCAETNLAGVQALLVRPPWEWSALLVGVSWDLGEFVWERLLEAGRGEVYPLGLGRWQQLIR